MDQRLLEKADYLLSQETGTIYKDPGGKITIALVYPNAYGVGMSSLGFQGIYGLLNKLPDVVCERAFLPSESDLEVHRRTNTDIFTIESKKPLSRFDIIAFSVSFENDYPNILKILSLAKVPLRSSERNIRHPLVVAGGVCCFYNPEPLADFMDICFIGEAEEMLPEFIALCRHSGTRKELYLEALMVEGIYIPQYYEVGYDATTHQIRERKALGPAPVVIKKRSAADLSGGLIKPVIITPEAEFANMYLAEAMRGCPWSCRFCVAGHIYNPARKKDLAVLRDEIGEALRVTKKVGLIGPSLSDYPHAKDVLAIEGVDFSITSLRASAHSGHIVSLMKGHKSISIAPEAGTARLRKAINKKISEEDILETAALILDSGIETLRLYFMAGLPTETTEDIEGIIDLVKKIRARNKRGYITLSVSTFVPKPFTPFQWQAMEKMAVVKDRQRILKKGLSGVKGVKVFHDLLKQTYIQGLLSVGDRRSSALIEKLAGVREGAVARADFDYYIFRNRDFPERLPWEFIDAGAPVERLWLEYQEALAACP
ncbi:MAG: radical SAM protein [Thermodesulfovibrio sp.]|nr:radical SAM protein [Thermodesulfovibrio sp.]